MPQNPLEQLDGAAKQVASTASESFRNEFLKSSIIVSGAADGIARGAEANGFLNLSNPFEKMSDPFKQDYDKADGFVDRLVHGFKKFFGKEDSMEDELKQHTEKQMAKEPATDGKGGTKADQLKREEDLYKEEMRKAMSDFTLAYMGPQLHKMPDLEHDPRFATMRELNERVKQTETEIQKRVADKLGPTVMGDVNKQMTEYEDTYKIHNPAGTGEGFRPHNPGPLLEYYWDKVREETHKTIQS